jgi:C-terminal processing protease CtpA/Prc
MQKILKTLSLSGLCCVLAACGGYQATTPTPPTPLTATPAVQATAQPESPTTTATQPVQIHGSIELSNQFVLDVYFYQRFALLEDLTGFVRRDYEYTQPLNGQILGPVTTNTDGELHYTLNLPAQPVSPQNDVDQDGKAEAGVMIWQVSLSANYLDDPFLSKDETGGWSTAYTSAKIDSENKNELKGGKLLIWAPDAQQAFASDFGADGLLFTADDPTTAVPANYSVVDLDQKPFAFSQPGTADFPLYEGDLAVNDFSELSWSAAFDALHKKASTEYPFTKLKSLDWDALYATIAPRIAAAEKSKDAEAYYLALRDYSWSIPDGHVGLGGDDFGLFQKATSGGYGLGLTGLSDGSVIANIVSPTGPAAAAGMTLGATILEWNGEPIDKALAAVKPWSAPFSNPEVERLQQYRYLVHAPLDTQATVTFQNPDSDSRESATLTASGEARTLAQSSFNLGFDRIGLPVQYEILPNGYGYVKITSLSEDISLILRLWERAVQVFADNDVPGIVVDLRQNSGGSPLGTAFASYFVQEKIEFTRSYYYSDKTGQFETFGSANYTEPDAQLYYGGKLAVLVGPACASACEDVAYILGELPQTTVVGFYSSNGIFGEVARGQYQLPGDYSFQIPTGYSADLNGKVVIEGPGVVPDVRVPRTPETVFSDVDEVLSVAVRTLDEGTATELNILFGEEASKALGQSIPLEQLAPEQYADISQAGKTYTYTITETNESALWVNGWCAKDAKTLTENLNSINLQFLVNGETLPLDAFGVLENADNNIACKLYYAVVTSWPKGETVLEVQVEFTNPITDGEQTYPAGKHSYVYTVNK